jgi:hypothetical protein
MNKNNFFFIAGIALIVCISACHDTDNKTDNNTRDSTSGVVIPPPDNSSATNPSLADTAYSKKDSLQTKRDTSIKH